MGFFSEDFGCKGDGVTDDTDSLIRALDEAENFTHATGSKGGHVMLRPGTYMVRPNEVLLRQGVYLNSTVDYRPYRGSFISAPVSIQALPGASGFVIDTPVTEIFGAGLNGVAVVGTSNTGTGVGTGGVRLRNAFAVKLTNLSFTNCIDEGILQDAGEVCVYDNVITTNCLLNRNRGAIAGTVTIGGSDHYVSRVQAGADTSADVHGVTSSDLFVNAILLNAFTSWIMPGTSGELSDRGIVVVGGRNYLIGVRADLNYGHGFEYITNGSNQNIGCVSSTNGRAADNTYSAFRVNSGGNLFTGTNGYKTGGFTLKYIYEDTLSLLTPISRNTFDATCLGSGYGTSLFSSDALQGSTILFPPRPYRIPDGTTIPDITGTTFATTNRYTAPATITNFTGALPGQDLDIDSANTFVTIANNATIKTNTGADKVLAANVIYGFKFYNGVWKERA